MEESSITYLSRSHHHSSTDGVQGVRRDTRSSGDGPPESERGEEVTLKGSDKKNGLDGVVHAEVQTTVHDNSEHRRSEATIETGDTVRRERLLVHIHETIELTRATLGRGLGVVGETGTSVIQGIDEEQRSGTGSLCAASMASFLIGEGYRTSLTPPEAKLPAIHLA